MYLKKLMALAIAMSISSPVFSASWTSTIEDGIKFASIDYGSDNEILVMCDIGVNAPITSINFIVNGTQPDPNSPIRLVFDKDEPIFANVDSEGGIGSVTATDAALFRKVLKNLKSKGKVKVRLFDGSEHSFALRGSTNSIGNCKPDHERFSLALN